MPPEAPTCSVYACHDAATFMLLADQEPGTVSDIPSDCLCTEHWLQLRVFDPVRAHRYLSIRYAVVDAEDPQVRTV